MRKFKSKPRAPAYVQEVYQRIETEMCTARNAVVALDLRIAPIVAKLPPEDQTEIEAALMAYNQTVCTAISKAGGLLAALGAALFSKFGKSSSGGQAVSHYESPFAGHDVYDSLTEFSTRAAMQHRYMEKTTGTDAQLGILQQIRDMLDEHLPDIGTGQLVMDGEKVADMLTPRLATNIDASMGVYTLRAERGV